jgi:hypothetical protein
MSRCIETTREGTPCKSYSVTDGRCNRHHNTFLQKSNPKCSKCISPPVIGKSMCQSCSDKKNKSQRDLLKIRNNTDSQHYCVGCECYHPVDKVKDNFCDDCRPTPKKKCEKTFSSGSNCTAYALDNDSYCSRHTKKIEETTSVILESRYGFCSETKLKHGKTQCNRKAVTNGLCKVHNDINIRTVELTNKGLQKCDRCPNIFPLNSEYSVCNTCRINDTQQQRERKLK